MENLKELQKKLIELGLKTSHEEFVIFAKINGIIDQKLKENEEKRKKIKA